MTFLSVWIGLGICLVIGSILRKDKQVKEYDERQMMCRGIAYRNGFLVTILLGLIATTAVLVEPTLTMYAIFMFYMSIVAGVAVFAVKAIKTDAYTSNTTVRKYIPLYLAVVVINSIVLVSNRSRYTFHEMLQSSLVTNIGVTILFLIVLIAFIVRARQESCEIEE